MSSSGLKEQNLMKTQNYNRSTKHQNSTKSAIAYTPLLYVVRIYSRNVDTRNELFVLFFVGRKFEI